MRRILNNMWVSYIDESAEDERRYMSMAAVMCSEGAIPKLTAALDAIVAKAVATHGVDPMVEIHTTAMVSRIDGWEKLPDVDAALAIIREVIEALCALPEVEFVTRGLDVEKQTKRYKDVWGPRRVLIQHVLEYCNVNMWGHGSFMVVVDDMSKPDEHRDLLRLYREKGTPGFRKSKLERVLDNVYFMPSHYARGIQAADVVAGVHRRLNTFTATTDARSRSFVEAMWKLLWDSGKVRAYGVWPT